jgi:ABC-2 type transport system ATP-binding protein
MIDAQGVIKRYGKKVAVDGMTFSVPAGVVTGFVGPNGAGKSTMMRIILGLDSPQAGRVTVNGRAYREHSAPLHEVGAMLEARAIHPGRSATNHLLAMAQTHGIGRKRVQEVIELVGLQSVARKRVGTFSLGMFQRLGIACGLLGDPSTLVLDEPSNGLDPEGILWIRTLLKGLAAEGRTVFVSSHHMSEMALTAGRLIVVGRGQLIADTTVEEFVRQAAGSLVRVRAPEAARFAGVLQTEGVSVARDQEPDTLKVKGMDAAEVGELAFAHGIVIHELTTEQASLEEAFMSMTRDATEFAAATPHGDVAIGTGA